MNLTKFSLAGALVLTLAACHTDGHEFCDWDDDGETDVGCVVLLKGAAATVGAVAFHANSEPITDSVGEN